MAGGPSRALSAHRDRSSATDRDLLDSSVDLILHLDRGKLTLYKGGYSAFEEARAAREMLDAKHARRQEAERKRLQAFVDRFKAKVLDGAAGAVASQDAGADEAGHRAGDAGRARDRLPSPEKMLSPPIIALDDVAVGYDPARPVLDRVTLRIDTDDRIALLGANGNGKSTLVKLIAGKLAPFSGKVVRADKLSVGYFAQHQTDELDPDGSPYDHLRRLMRDAPESKVRARVGAIGFSGKAGDTLVKSLSGGEKARLLLGLATFHAPNLIILDEPTNHLDIDSRAALAEAINDFPGAVIMVSHDRYLIEACADRLWVVADRTVTPYDGDLDDYRRSVLSARGIRGAPRERDDTSRDKPARAKSPRQKPLGRRSPRPRARSRGSPASSPRSMPRWRCRTSSRAIRCRRRNWPRRAPAPPMRWPAPRTNGSPRARPTTRRDSFSSRRESGLAHAPEWQALSALRPLLLCAARGLLRLRHVDPLDGSQPPRGEGVGARPRAVPPGDQRDAVAALVLERLTSSGAAAMARTTSHSVWPSATGAVTACGAAGCASDDALASADAPGVGMPAHEPSAPIRSLAVTSLVGVSGGVSIEVLPALKSGRDARTTPDP